MGCIVPRVFYGSVGSEPTSRSRLLLDQRTPAEKEMSEEAKQKQRKVWGITCGTLFLLLIVGGIMFYLFLDDMLPSNNNENTWSLNKINLLSGFKIMEYARITKPRSLHASYISPGITITYVGTNSSFVYAIVDFNSNGMNVATYQIWQSLQSFGACSIVVNEDTETLYIDDMIGNVWQCPNVHQQVLDFTSPADRLENCNVWLNVPFGGQIHNTHYMTIHPNGNLCMAFGVVGDVPQPDSVEGTIRCFNSYEEPSIDNTTVYAYGIRNSVGFDFHPESGQLWFTDCSPNGLWFDLPDDELNRVTIIGEHYGFPYCLTAGEGPIEQRMVGTSDNIPDPIYGALINNSCDEEGYIPGYQAMGPHVESLGMKFVWSEKFADPMSNRFILIAQHGSVNRNPPIGARIMIAELFSGSEGIYNDIVEYYPFAWGWLDDNTNKIYGRPVDVEWLKYDDSFIVTDDERNVVYRIYYEPDTDVESEEEN
eukprot:108322_1